MSRSSGLIIPGGGGGGSTIITQESDVLVNAAADTIDFMDGFDLLNLPGTRTKIFMDLSEYAGAPLPIVGGGTGQSGKTAAFDALSPLTTRGDLLTDDGTDSVRLPIGTNHDVLATDGTDPLWVRRPRCVVAESFTQTANIAGNQSLLSGGAVSAIPANSLALTDAFRVTGAGQFHNTTGGASTMFVYLVVGGATINLTLTTISVAANAHRKWWFDAQLSVFALGGAGVGTIVAGVSSDVAASGAALWVVANSILDVPAISLDTTVANSIDLRCSSSVASASISCDLDGFTVLYIPAPGT